jgi:hypothetical protein
MTTAPFNTPLPSTIIRANFLKQARRLQEPQFDRFLGRRVVVVDTKHLVQMVHPVPYRLRLSPCSTGSNRPRSMARVMAPT